VSSLRGLEFDCYDEFVSVRCVSVAVGSKDQRNLSGIGVPSGLEEWFLPRGMFTSV